jgi:hypothetical protein
MLLSVLALAEAGRLADSCIRYSPDLLEIFARSACRKAGLPGRRIHNFRRAAVRRSEHGCVSRSVSMKLTGHKTDEVYRWYAIVSQSELENAARRLDVLGRARSKQDGEPTEVSKYDCCVNTRMFSCIQTHILSGCWKM